MTARSRRVDGGSSAPEVRATLASVAAALGWVLLSSASLLVGAVALLTTLALARNADHEASAGVLWLVALTITLGVPCALAVWKHHRDARRIRATMVWLPAAWNFTGLVLATQLIPDVTGTALRSVEWVVQGELGHTHWSTRVLSAVGHEAADRIDPRGTVTSTYPPPSLTAPRIDNERAFTVPLNDEGTAIMLDNVQLHGSANSLQAKYLFDTGASFTTITGRLASQLGLRVPSDAPAVKFNTASGPRESKMVYLPKLVLGGVEIPGLLVSVCDSCSNEHTQGLLGLNVMREFLVQLDYMGGNMELLPRHHEGRPDRAYDIFPIVELNVEGGREIWLNRVRWVVLVHNRGTQPIESIIPRVEFTGGGPILFGEPIERIEPGEVGRSRVEGKVEAGRGRKGPTYRLSLAQGYWGR
ncbi:MAG: hypothetical protein B7733_07770 [Myxococcales bacterium FL481]|nr:MAG: hypothetical protein B7733_07770 [Myxococcales bacterium FL481]